MYTNITNAQNKQCNTPEPSIDIFNEISKCTIEKKGDETNSKDIVMNVSSKKTRRRIIRKREKANSINNTNNLQKEISSDAVEIKKAIVSKNITSQEILFSIVDEVPLFPNCEVVNNNNADCFNKEFSKHFAKNFTPESASENGISGRVYIQFNVDQKGNTTNLLIKSRKNNKQLEKEIKLVISKLPKFTPGRHEGLPVNVKYSLPINFNTD